MHWGGTNKLSDCTLNLVSWCTGARIGPPGLVQVACTSGGKAAYLVLIRSTKRCADRCMVHMFLYLVHMRSAHTWCTHLVRILGAHTWCMFLVHIFGAHTWCTWQHFWCRLCFAQGWHVAAAFYINPTMLDHMSTAYMSMGFQKLEQCMLDTGMRLFWKTFSGAHCCCT